MARRLTRTEIDQHIAQLAELWGWRHHHGPPSLTLDGRTDGFPPHVLADEDGRLVFVAIAPSHNLAAPEAAWAQLLANAGSIEVHVVGRELRSLTHRLRPSAADSEPRAPPGGTEDKDVRPGTSGADVRSNAPRQAPPQPGGSMRRTDVIVDPRAPAARRRGELRPIGPILDRAVAEIRVRSLATDDLKRQAA